MPQHLEVVLLARMQLKKIAAESTVLGNISICGNQKKRIGKKGPVIESFK
jgi:hypothetical protein